MNKRPIFIIFVTVFIDLLGFGIIIPILPSLAKQLSGSNLMVGVVAASFSFMQFLFAPYWGNLSDKIGRRPVILYSLAVTSVAYLVFSFAATLWILIIARLFAGIGSANIGTAQAYLSDITTPAQRPRAMGLIGAAFGLGFTCGPPIGAYLMEGYGVAGIGYFTALLCLANLALAFKILPETHKINNNKIPNITNPFNGLINAFKTPVLSRLFLIQALFIVAFSLMQITAALLWEEHFGLNAKTIGWVFAFIGISAAIVQGTLVGLFVKKLGYANMLKTGTLLMAIGLIGLPYVPKHLFFPLELVFLAIIALANGLIMPAISSLVSLKVKENEQGHTLGLLQSSSSLSRGIGPLAGGALYAIGMQIPYIIGALTMLICVVLSFFLAKYLRKDFF
jgi:DHA1 family tetracycline resistance protein-like MFS transporter